jgi:sigma-B regulation protein RsbU (phosphoserine phosphatase)
MENLQTIREAQKHRGAGSARRSRVSARRNRALEEQLENLRREHDELLRTMFEAAQLQRRLCGPRHLRRKSCEIATEIFPVRHLSGDFAGVFDWGADLVLALGDIAGKGLQAALWFTHLVSVLRLHLMAHRDPAAALQAVNRDLCGAKTAPPLTTLFLARLNPSTGEITYCNAGHPPTLLLRREGPVEMLREAGPVLGAIAEASYTNGESRLQYGDTLLGYSDGILESRNLAGAEFGMERLVEAARRAARSSASAALFSVLAAAEDFASDQPREDDVALVVVHRA